MHAVLIAALFVAVAALVWVTFAFLMPQGGDTDRQVKIATVLAIGWSAVITPILVGSLT